QFNTPGGLAIDSTGNLYVGDTDNYRIRKVRPVGTNWVVTTLAGLAGSPGSANGTNSSARFRVPTGVAVDNAGSVYVADRDNHTIRQVTTAGEVTTLAELAGYGRRAVAASDGCLIGLEGVGVDNASNVYVVNRGNRTIQTVAPAGAVTTLAGLA